MNGRKPKMVPTPSASSRSDSAKRQSAERYDVGYKKPPRHSRFKPGQSGNPKGRKKHSRNLSTVLDEILYEQVEITEGSRKRRMTRAEALARHTMNRAFKDPRALAALLLLMKQTGLLQASELVSTDEVPSADAQDVIEDFLRRHNRDGR